jgi:hypothetical protein
MRLVKQYGSYEESVFYREPESTVPSPFRLPPTLLARADEVIE